MADQSQMAYTYDYLDRIFRYSIGEYGDYSGAKYDGDFSMSLEEAQQRKHAFITDQLGIGKGSRVLDMGCGWGPILNHIRTKGAEGVGVTLSEQQAKACRKNGLDVRVMDCRKLTPSDVGHFDAIVSLGAFEHFCSIEEWQRGDQDAVYSRLFDTVATLLRPGGRFFLQTMVFGENMIPFEEIDMEAPADSPAYIMAAILAQFPGSWLPENEEQVIRNAERHFRLVNHHSGRTDYIETIKQWGTRFRRFGLKKYAYYLTLLPRYVTDRSFREHLRIVQVGSIRQSFEKKILNHFRFVFELV